MEFIDLASQQKRIINKIESNIKAVLDHGKYIMGPEVKTLEETLTNYVGVKHAVSCASGTDALLMALMAYKIGQGDAVFTTPFTFIATAEVISLLGATPVFVDIDANTYNIDPQKLEQAIKKTRIAGNALRPKAIIAVDLFGLTADYDAIKKIAQDHQLIVIEDAAQSFGADYKNKKACSFGDIACTSFFPAKPLGCYGDGGMCFTNNTEIETVLKSIRVHGQGGHKYDNVRIGINGRIDTMQAAILLAKFDIFPEEIALRQEVAVRYSKLLSSISLLKTPKIPEGYQSAWAQYSILAENEKQREMLLAALNKEKIPSAIYYPKSLHQQEAFSFLDYRGGDFPVSEAAAARIFSLPMHPYLKMEDQQKIANVLGNALK
jgi:UDP-2-acetamido-2-deoxy-ribo-hexuluronate aminotransferase